jgi:murein DD-endopeptidase MepM/ murein hydrolase activator NlpD
MPVLASRSGIVASAKQVKGMGKYVFIRHFGGYSTLYGHLSAIKVKKNQIVRRGTVIGLVGKTGNANYRSILPHLHFEIRKNGIPQDPLFYLDQ